jgi:hypothetical protein
LPGAQRRQQLAQRHRRPLLAGDDPSVFEGIKLSWLKQLQC